MLTYKDLAVASPRVGERGFTMIEMVIAMACAAIVVAALAAVMQVALDQSTRLSDVTAADQIGRGAMNQIVEELHSSCTGFEATAIQVPSGTVTSPLTKLNATSLWFLSAWGTGTGSEESFYKKMYEHDIAWEKTGEVSGKKLGKLVDYRFANTGEQVSGVWPFPALTSENATPKGGTILAENVVYPSEGGLFTYYQLANSSSKAGVKKLSSESEIQTVAGEKTNGIGKVEIHFSQAPPTDKNNGRPTAVVAEGHTVPFQAAVVLRFNAIEPESEEIDKPCK
jgi:prepilin-type N-terminal cleavage/methylation domain-containing protein